METDGLNEQSRGPRPGRAADAGVAASAVGADSVVGLGTDLVAVGRVADALARTPGLVDRLFTPEEAAWCTGARGPAVRSQRFAARFAAKEAAMKALGVGLGGIGWHDVEVRRGARGAPALRVTGRAAELAAARGGTRWLVSMSHTADLAQATVLLLA